MRIGFDNEKYLALQAEHIRERIGQFGGKLYLEFGGKLFCPVMSGCPCSDTTAIGRYSTPKAR